jgi:hypothetical protein
MAKLKYGLAHLFSRLIAGEDVGTPLAGAGCEALRDFNVEPG